MEAVYSILFMILFVFAGFLFVAGVIFLIVKLVKNKDKEAKPFNLTINLLFKIYLYIISFITLIVAVYGGTLLIKSGSSYLFGIPFSYDLVTTNVVEKDVENNYVLPECYSGSKMTINNQDVCFNENDRKQDLVNGITFFTSMIILFVLHQIALVKLEKKNPTPLLKKIYTFVSLVLYSMVGVIIIPTAIYQLTTYLMYRVSDVTSYTAPATSIGILIMVLPLWVIFLVRTTRMKEEE